MSELEDLPVENPFRIGIQTEVDKNEIENKSRVERTGIEKLIHYVGFGTVLVVVLVWVVSIIFLCNENDNE